MLPYSLSVHMLYQQICCTISKKKLRSFRKSISIHILNVVLSQLMYSYQIFKLPHISIILNYPVSDTDC